MTSIKTFFLSPIPVVRAHRRALGVLAAVSFGAFLVGVLATLFVPELRPGGLGAIQGSAGTPGVGSLVGDAYRSGNVAVAAAVTLAVNLFLASLLQTTLPTLIVPFLGVVITVLRSLFWGVLFTPFGAEDPHFLVHWVTLVIEGAAYLVVAFAAWVQGRYFVQPQRFGFATRRAGYLAGLKATSRLYILVIVLLVVGAIYEAVTVIHVIA